MSSIDLMRVYLAHPWMDRAGGKTLQTKIEALGIEVVNPFEKVEQQIYDKAIKHGDGTALSDADIVQIVEGDLAEIDGCEGVVAYLPDGVPSLGAIMEIFYAGNILRRGVYVLTDSERVAGHPWIRYHALVFKNEDDLLTALKEDLTGTGDVENV